MANRGPQPNILAKSAAGVSRAGRIVTERSQLLGEVAWLTLFLWFALGGLALLVISVLPIDLVAAKASAAAPDGDVESFHEWLPVIQMRARALAVPLLLLAISLLCWRRRVVHYIREATASFPTLANTLSRQLRQLFLEEEKLHRYALFAILFIATALRIRELSLPVFTDEAQTFVNYASRPLYAALSFYARPNNHLFHTLLVHLIYGFFGSDVWLLRLPALLAGILLVPASYAVARSFFGRDAALLSTAFVAGSYPLVAYSSQARGYTLICLFFLCALLVGNHLLKSDDRLGWLMLAATMTLGLWTMPTMVYAVVALSAWLLLAGRANNQISIDSRWLRGFLLALLLTVVGTFLAYLPALAVSGAGAVIHEDYLVPPSAEFFRGLPGYLLALWRYWTRDIPILLSVTLGAGLAVAVLFGRGRRTDGFVLCSAVGLSIPATLLVQGIMPSPRVWLFLFPLGFAVASAGVVAVVQRAGLGIPNRIFFPLLALATTAALTFQAIQRDPMRDLLHAGMTRPEPLLTWLKDEVRPGDSVVAYERLMHPMRFYLMQSDLLQHWAAHRGSLSAERIFLVVHDPLQSLERVLEIERAHTPIERYDAPARVGTYGNVTLYQLQLVH